LNLEVGETKVNFKIFEIEFSIDHLIIETFFLLVLWLLFDKMRVAIEGCMHGELTKVYDTIKEIETREGYKIDLVKKDNSLILFS